MKYTKTAYDILGRFANSKRFGIETRQTVNGYTVDEHPEIGIRKNGKSWYVDHLPTGCALVSAGSATRDAALNAYLDYFQHRLEAIKPETIREMTEHFRSAPLDSDLDSWETVHCVTLYDYRLEKLTNAARRAGCIIRKGDKDTYLHGGCIDISGPAESLQPIRDLIAHYEQHDAEKAARLATGETETTAEAETTTTETRKENPTMKNYFANLTTETEIKAVYKALSTVFHPDNGGDTATMQEINRQRSAALAALKQDDAPADEPAPVILLPEQCPTRANIPTALLEVLDAARRLPCLHLEVCGSWLWATGSTKPVKEQLKALGFRFSANKSAWYWHDPSKPYRRRRGGRKYDMDEIREMHGSRIIA